MTKSDIVAKRKRLDGLVTTFFNVEEAAHEQKLDDIPIILTQEEVNLVMETISIANISLAGVEQMIEEHII